MESNYLRDYNFKISYGPSDDRLHDFYIPALSRSVRYDRSAGFFSSTALAVAAAGVARLIKNGGTMRLLVGAQLSEEDVEAIRKGDELRERLSARLLNAISDPEDAFLKRRLEVLAWMVAEGTLEIKVVLPKGRDGAPLPASVAADYYHPKEGVFTDANGDQIAFSGSVNESETGWIHNYEQFMVYRSWDASFPFLNEVVNRFERLWRDEEPSWIAVSIPEAVKSRLLKFRPQQVPRKPSEAPGVGAFTIDPLERTDNESILQKERILFQFIRDAPFLPNASGLGMATSSVTPWPHQQKVVEDIVERFPERFLLCDEVGLGKTIEVGIVIRQLIISGKVNRCLILTPKSILKQWQEELYEKFVLNIPRYDGGRFIDVFDREIEPSSENPFNSFPVILVSSQLVKRKERQPQLLQAEPWDLIVVDEAHHARRKDFQDERYRPNRLLELLTGLKNKTQGMLLLTATPMQIHPVEVWDLLKVLGLGGRWGAIQDNFLDFFAFLREPFFDVNWEFVFNMVRDFLELGGTLDALFCEHAKQQLGLVEWQQIQSLPYSNKRGTILKMLESQSRVFVVEFAKRHTPLRRYLFRNTRSLLREYQSRGILSARVPKREPVLEWIPMRSEERKLYDRIEEYISDFYEKYESERKGLGFVMTVYRRRLTSSFYAMERSLERRLAYLAGEPEKDTIAGLDDDDLEQDELQADVGEALEDTERDLFRGEIEYIEDFLTDLRRLASDSKLEQLLSDLREIFKKRETVLIFTQYTDTMDYLREQLRHVYGNQVACYCGRGGEYWDGGRWVRTTKEQIKNAFRSGDEIKILLGTEAASEGLNLQTCGVLINYDMPWNPMRVEQRIGRIDRIGQEHEVVFLRNYFYADTVEATVYQRLSDRIGWFEEVVGELQPILSQVARTIQTIAMIRKEERAPRLETEIEALRKELDKKAVESLRLDDYLDTTMERREAETPITLQQLESLMVTSRSIGSLFRPHPSFAGAHLLHWDGEEHAVTFNPILFDKHPNSMRLLSFGDELFDELLSGVEHLLRSPNPESPALREDFGPDASERMGISRCWAEAPVRMVAYYILQEGCPQQIETYNDLKAILESDASLNAVVQPLSSLNWSDEMIAKAQEDFLSEVKAAQANVKKVEDYRQKSHQLALEEEGRQLLLRTAFIELAMQAKFDDSVSLTFNEDAIKALRLHKYPFAGLLKLVDIEGLRPTPTHPFYLKSLGASVESLSQRFRNIREQAAALLNQLANLKVPSTVEETESLCEITTIVIKRTRNEESTTWKRNKRVF